MTNFEQLYQMYFKDVYLFILSMSKDPELAEEITQETFYKAMRAIHRYKGQCSLKVWLCQIAKNTYFTWLKKKKAEPVAEVPETADGENIEDNYIQKEGLLSIYKILHYLPEPYKEVFTLRTLGNLSFGEIAEIFEKSEGWARVTFHRSRMKIQEMMKEEQI